MVRFVKALLGTGSAPRRIMLTPGRLYFLMSQELRQSRPRGRCNCSMPLPFVVTASEGGANWDARLGMMQCPDCTETAVGILARYRRIYDLNPLELQCHVRSAAREEPDMEDAGLRQVRAFG